MSRSHLKPLIAAGHETYIHVYKSNKYLVDVRRAWMQSIPRRTWMTTIFDYFDSWNLETKWIILRLQVHHILYTVQQPFSVLRHGHANFRSSFRAARWILTKSPRCDQGCCYGINLGGLNAANPESWSRCILLLGQVNYFESAEYKYTYVRYSSNYNRNIPE